MNQLIKINRPVYILSSAAVGGKKEKQGPLGKYFDITDDDDTFGQKTWENSESEMQRVALNTALAKLKRGSLEGGVLIAGDLMNQCTGSVNGLKSFDLPFFGIFGACSTSAQGLALAAMLLDAGYYQNAAVVTSSHFCSAERQFRFPLEYGGQRTPTSQWTATAAGAFILSPDAPSQPPTLQPTPRISDVMLGRITDGGITDANFMGAAMAPAAAATLQDYFSQSGSQPGDFDVIATGDLGRVGMQLASEMLLSGGLDVRDRYTDCGTLLYSLEAQGVDAGGSGCGCSASVAAGFMMDKLHRGEYKNILLLATGALMSPSSVQQGNSIPGIAHLVHICV